GLTRHMSLTMNIIDSDLRIDAPLALPEDEVQLWRVDLEAIRSDESRWQSVLSPDESKRASRFHFVSDRQRFVASRALLRTILGAYLTAHANDLSFSYSEEKKPSLGSAHADSGLTFNVSHSGAIALYAFTRRREIGVDVEQARRDFDVERIARRFFSPREQRRLADFSAEERVDAFFRCWTRKEAYIKATGKGLSLPLTQFDVSLGPVNKSALLETRPDGSEAGRWFLREVRGGAGYMAALCVRGQDWKLKDWSGDTSS
ncbi:MAG: 4'-phosphopantetheinyl transferase superfamily protein, partial [Candidatus Sulfotelmatobacter sp.]